MLPWQPTKVSDLEKNHIKLRGIDNEHVYEEKTPNVSKQTTLLDWSDVGPSKWRLA